MVNSMTDREPILASWKISDVLTKYPELLDVLVDLTPAFRKLRNPVLRKVQTRLVTVRQAAGIAGLEPGELVRTLNQAVGIAPPDDEVPVAPVGPRAVPSWVGVAPVVRELNVTELLAKGEGPFRVITRTAREVKVGEVMRLVTSFEPIPLYDALGKQGFSHWSERIDGPDWQVLFHKDRETAVRRVNSNMNFDWADSIDVEVTIDVSELVPPEPMIKILRALEELPDGGRLLVHHVRRPMHLYDQLDEMGYAHLTREPEPGRVEILIQKSRPPS